MKPAKNGPCTICLNSVVAVIHSHHTVPRSRGGEDSLQIPLCPDCHNALHAYALAIVASIKSNTRKIRKTYFAPQDESRAIPYLEILVRALLERPLLERDHLLSTLVKTSVFERLKLLQLDMGFSSMEKTLAFCIEHTTSNILGVNKNGKAESSSKLWFLHLSGKGQSVR